MKKPKCKLCQSPHWTYESHAINAAINKEERLTDAINETASAINSPDPPSPPAGDGARPVAGGFGLRSSDGEGARESQFVRPDARALDKTPNRRSREAYNSYMRDYMRAYRERSRE